MIEIKTPDCPRCGLPPRMVISAKQAFCGNDACDAFCWDMTETKAQNEAGATFIDISGWPK